MNFNMLKLIHSSIKHGVNLIRHQFRDVGVATKRSSHWPTVEKHFREANPKCAICESVDRLNVHHKKPFHLHPELELDTNNLITLCMSKMECHLMIGHGDDFKAYNPNIETDAPLLNKDISKFAEVAARAKLDKKFE